MFRGAFCAVLVSLFCGVGCFTVGRGDLTGQKCGVEASSNLVHRSPWLVYLEYYRHDDEVGVRCGASLVGPRHIVTAAHCVKKIRYSRLVARFGEYDLDSEIDCVDGVCADPVVRIEVEDYQVHPDYKDPDHDIAVLRLKEDAPYTDFIRPICLPSGPLGDNVTFTAAGFGEIPNLGIYSNVKKNVPLPNFGIDNCKAAYHNTDLPQKIICAGGEEGIDTCRGDSGGPLASKQDKAELHGVTISGNVHCGAKGFPGIYIRVLDYVDWIESIVQI